VLNGGQEQEGQRIKMKVNEIMQPKQKENILKFTGYVTSV
jgi:hypothetical protein